MKNLIGVLLAAMMCVSLCGVFKTESGDCTTGVSDEVNL